MALDVEFRLALRHELPAVLRVQHEAFGRVSRELGIDPASLPPLRESAEDLEALYDAGMAFFVAIAENTVIGSVRGRLEDGAVEVGRLVVDGSWLRRGVGSSLMALLETHFSAARRFELFTGADAAAPLATFSRSRSR